MKNVKGKRGVCRRVEVLRSLEFSLEILKRKKRRFADALVAARTERRNRSFIREQKLVA